MIAVIDYNAGNIASVTNALHRLNVDYVVTKDGNIIRSADKVIMPGVGAASSAMESLNDLGLVEVIKQLQNPFLGICLGLQILCTYSEEDNTTCIGIFDIEVKRFVGDEKVPHMGWNAIHDLKGSLYYGVPDGADMYFVHSYYAELSAHTVATCEYILPFSASIQRDNFYATQYHVEKSSKLGTQILQNFIQL